MLCLCVADEGCWRRRCSCCVRACAVWTSDGSVDCPLSADPVRCVSLRGLNAEPQTNNGRAKRAAVTAVLSFRWLVGTLAADRHADRGEVGSLDESTGRDTGEEGSAVAARCTASGTGHNQSANQPAVVGIAVRQRSAATSSNSEQEGLVLHVDDQHGECCTSMNLLPSLR